MGRPKFNIVEITVYDNHAKFHTENILNFSQAYPVTVNDPEVHLPAESMPAEVYNKDDTLQAYRTAAIQVRKKI
jgi:hypothetical protein